MCPLDNNQYPISKQRLRFLKQVVGKGPLLILTHDNPDPDALASGAILAALFESRWGVKAHLGYSGMVARAENKAMLDLLTPQWVPVEELGDLNNYPVWAFVDTQPGAGNNSIPGYKQPKVVFDHHPLVGDQTESIPFVDIRPEMGATTSLVYQYFEAAGLEPDSDLATAIFYGIQTDTQGLARSGSQLDQEFYVRLLGRINRKKLSQVIQACVPREYYRAFNRGLESAQVYKKVVISYLGKLHRPDFVAELADALIRLEGIEAALCLGYHQDVMFLSLRTPKPEDHAGQIIRSLLDPLDRAGGHESMAGGQIRLGEIPPDQLAEIVCKKFLKRMNEESPGEKLL